MSSSSWLWPEKSFPKIHVWFFCLWCKRHEFTLTKHNSLSHSFLASSRAGWTARTREPEGKAAGKGPLPCSSEWVSEWVSEEVAEFSPQQLTGLISRSGRKVEVNNSLREQWCTSSAENSGHRHWQPLRLRSSLLCQLIRWAVAGSTGGGKKCRLERDPLSSRSR